MDHAPTIVISLMIGLLLGIGGGYFAADYSKSKNFKEVVSSNPSVLFDECQNVPNDAQEICANSVLLRRALQLADVTICESISTQSQKASCLASVEYIENFDEQFRSLCNGVQNRQLCSELMQFLAADLQQDASLCTKIASNELRQACASRLPVNQEQQALAQEELDALFGPICPISNADCDDDAVRTKEIILGGDREECADAGIFRDLCINETELYSIYSSVGVVGCEDLPEQPPVIEEQGSLQSRLTQGVCQTQLITAQALEQQDISICDALEVEALIAGCKLSVERSSTGRFDYLTQ